MPPVAYEDLEGKDGTFENIPGTEQTFYFAPIEEVLSAPEPLNFDAITGMNDAALIDGTTTPITMKTGKKMYALNLLMNSGQIEGETVGDRGSRAVKTSVEAFYIGSTKQIYGLQRVLKEGKYIVLAPHANGDVQQIGRLKKPALISISTSTGKEEEGAKGATISIEAIDASGWIYEGEIPTTEAV